ncbi:MAG: metallophosphoesterase [Planctomycetaceae bacterium]|jgi:3',5'-cyclic AMP phosphodiesterase CpdA|nr:metallophosphoesterase [Planctomycetaceae bacterium]
MKKCILVVLVIFLSVVVNQRLVCCEELGKLVVVHLCDPQLGMGGFDADLARFEQAVRQVNQLSPDVVVIAGDMVNDIKSEREVVAIKGQIAKLKPPVLLTAGNHDLPDPVTAEGLERYRRIFGNDFNTLECKGWVLISANSQLWRKAPAGEVERHEKLLSESLQKARRGNVYSSCFEIPEADASVASRSDCSRAKPTAHTDIGIPIILITHIPPFVSSADEKDDYHNIPKIKRGELLEKFEQSGVIIWLSGHLHKTLKRKHGKITILNGETTSKNFDKRPYGFRLLTIQPDKQFDWTFVPLK